MGDILPAVLAFILGLGVSFLNYIVTGAALKNGTRGMGIMPLRTLITAAFIAGVYFGGRALDVNTAALLIGAAAGLTVGLTVSTFVLMRNREK